MSGNMPRQHIHPYIISILPTQSLQLFCELVVLPWATAPFPWLHSEHGTIYGRLLQRRCRRHDANSRLSCLWPPCVADANILFCSCSFFFMAALRSRCGHYSFVLWFLLSSSSFSWPNLGCHRLDVYHTSRHDVTLVRIQYACMKCAPHSLLKIQDAKNRHLDTITQLCPAISSQLRHVSTIGKKLLNSNICTTCPHHIAGTCGGDIGV